MISAHLVMINNSHSGHIEKIGKFKYFQSYVISQQGKFSDFLKAINNPKLLGMKGSYLGASATALSQRITKFAFGTTGKVFKARKTTFDMSTIIKKNVILDLELFGVNENFEGMYVFLNVFFHFFFHCMRQERESINFSTSPILSLLSLISNI
ncbi:MAG: hypothetical protein ACXAEU_06265 [Candidatus Hodarchaeales archaeon]|jgi:hypothetical protein